MRIDRGLRMGHGESGGRPGAAGFAAALAGLLLLGGCVAPYGERVDPVALERDRALGPEAAFVVPASGGPSVLGVIERIYLNAVRQKIVLQNDGSVSGENTIEVTFYGPLNASSDAGKLKRDTGTLRDIGIEMRRKIPVAMAVSPDFAQNTLGPFGFALGGGAGSGRCIYAWQRIHAQRNVFLEPSARGEISLRLRYCQRGVSDDTLLGLMYGIAIVATLPNRNWNPYGTPPPADPAVGARGEVIRPVLQTPVAPASAPAQVRRQQGPAAGAGGRAPAAAVPGVRTTPQRVVAPDRLPTPVAEPALVRPSAPVTVSPPLQMPPTLGDAPASTQTAPPSAQPRVPAAPSASVSPSSQPVRQVAPVAPVAVPPAPAVAAPGRVPSAPVPSSLPSSPASPAAPAVPRVAP